MRIAYSKAFLKQAKSLPPKLRKQLFERLTLFQANPLHPQLRNHSLKGKFSAYRSINLTGDYRILYLQNEEEVIFDKIGTHAELY